MHINVVTHGAYVAMIQTPSELSGLGIKDPRLMQAIDRLVVENGLLPVGNKETPAGGYLLCLRIGPLLEEWQEGIPHVIVEREVQITKELVEALSEKTGEPMRACRKALVEANGNLSLAEERLRV